eukprot:CFRG3089T1
MNKNKYVGLDKGFKDRKRAIRETVDAHFDYKNCVIGEGTYGLVYKAKRKITDRRSDDRVYALKKIKGTDSDGLSLSSCREIGLLREIKHQNLVSLEEVYLHPETRDVWLLFEYAEHDLYHILHTHRNTGPPKGQLVLLGDQMVKSIMWQLLQGMKYLHDNWILHRDLKPANILLIGSGREIGTVKICDLGMARVFNTPLKRLSDVDPVVVTIWYRAPELLLGSKHYTKAIDMWAIGCIFAELMTTKPIFRGHQEESDKFNRAPFQKDQCDKIFRLLGCPTAKYWPDVKKLPESDRLSQYAQHKSNILVNTIKNSPYFVRETMPKEAYDLLVPMLELNPSRRYTCEGALNCKYFKQEPLAKPNIFSDVSHNVAYVIHNSDDKNSVTSVNQLGGSTQPPPVQNQQATRPLSSNPSTSQQSARQPSNQPAPRSTRAQTRPTATFGQHLQPQAGPPSKIQRRR